MNEEDMIEVLGSIVGHEIDSAEAYLDEEVRPVLGENWNLSLIHI